MAAAAAGLSSFFAGANEKADDGAGDVPNNDDDELDVDAAVKEKGAADEVDANDEELLAEPVEAPVPNEKGLEVGRLNENAGFVSGSGAAASSSSPPS